MAETIFNDAVSREVVRQYEFSKKKMTPFFDRFLDNYKHYFIRTIDEAVEENPDAYPFYSQLMIPVSFQIVETLLPRMFSRLPAFTIKTEENNDEDDEMGMEELLRYQMNHPYLIDDPVFMRLATAAKEEFITGNAWGTVPWKVKEVEVEEWQPISHQMGLLEPSWENLDRIKFYGLQPQWVPVKIKKRVIDAPVFQHECIFNVYPDTSRRRVSDLGYVVFEDFMSYDQIMDMVNVSPRDYKNIDQLKNLQKWKDNGSKSGTDYMNEVASIFGAEDYTGKDDTSKDQHQFKVLVRKTPTTMSVVVNDKLTIRHGANPDGDGKIGVILMKDIPVPHQLFAWGEVDPIKRIEDQMSDLSNMRFDNVFRDLLRMWKLDPQALVDGEEFIPEPGTVVQMSNLEGLREIETGNTKATAYREYQEWEQILQNVTGVTDYATGQAAPGMNNTRGGVELLQQAANARFSFKLQTFETLGLKAMGTMYVQRNLRYFSRNQAVDTDAGKRVITPDSIRRLRGTIHFMVDSGSTEYVNKSLEMSKWDKILELVSKGQPPFHNLSEEALDYVARQALRSIGERNTEVILQRNPNPQQPVEGGAAPGGAPAGGAMPQDLANAIQQMQSAQGGAPAPEAAIPQEMVE